MKFAQKTKIPIQVRPLLKPKPSDNHSQHDRAKQVINFGNTNIQGNSIQIKITLLY